MKIMRKFKKGLKRGVPTHTEIKKNVTKKTKKKGGNGH